VRKAVLVGLVLLVCVGLAGCYRTDHALIINEDWEAVVTASVFQPFEDSVEQMNDLKTRIELLLPFANARIENLSSGPLSIGFDPMPFDQLPFARREELVNGDWRVSVELPRLVTAVDSEGDPIGPLMAFTLYLPGTVIDANTLTIDNEYVMQTYSAGERRAAVSWVLSPAVLAEPVTLWAIFRPRARDVSESTSADM